MALFAWPKANFTGAAGKEEFLILHVVEKVFFISFRAAILRRSEILIQIPRSSAPAQINIVDAVLPCQYGTNAYMQCTVVAGNYRVTRKRGYPIFSHFHARSGFQFWTFRVAKTQLFQQIALPCSRGQKQQRYFEDTARNQNRIFNTSRGRKGITYTFRVALLHWSKTVIQIKRSAQINITIDYSRGNILPLLIVHMPVSSVIVRQFFKWIKVRIDNVMVTYCLEAAEQQRTNAQATY